MTIRLTKQIDRFVFDISIDRWYIKTYGSQSVGQHTRLIVLYEIPNKHFSMNSKLDFPVAKNTYILNLCKKRRFIKNHIFKSVFMW